jgi:hypothetical protein
VRRNASAVLMSGFGSPLRTKMPIPTLATIAWLPSAVTALRFRLRRDQDVDRLAFAYPVGDVASRAIVDRGAVARRLVELRQQFIEHAFGRAR